MKSPLWKQIFQYAFGALISVAFFWSIWLLAVMIIPVENKDAFLLVIGALIGAFTTIVGYFFGSSKGSSDKNDIIKGEK